MRKDQYSAARLRAAAAGALAVLFCTAAHAAGPAAASILPVKGLVLTSTVRSAFVAGARSYSTMDAEEWDSVADANPDGIDYQIRFSAPANAHADADLRRFVLHRRVRREDIAQSRRINLFNSSQDPEMFAGQTFLETSVEALGQLKSGADVPYVIGVIDGEDPLGGIGALIRQVGAQSGTGKSGAAPLAGLASLFSAAGGHTYYRGNLRRVESAPVRLRVLLDGAPVSLPALHAQGTIVNGDKVLQVQFWWLDSRTWPLALKWTLAHGAHAASQQITRIDLPPQGGSTTTAMANELRQSCHLELSGIYFNTGSAILLPESQPALRQIAQLVRQSKAPLLEVQGHTDNIGTAQFNQELSQQRAEAVRQALVSRFGIQPGKLTSRGFGFSRPVDTNDTVLGRAHNRRVELACPGTT